MAQDSDVARVAAALKAPGIRYKNFGNEPVRTHARAAENVSISFPLLGDAMEAAAAVPLSRMPDAEDTVLQAPEPVPEAVPSHAPPAYSPPPMAEPAPMRHHDGHPSHDVPAGGTLPPAGFPAAPPEAAGAGAMGHAPPAFAQSPTTPASPTSASPASSSTEGRFPFGAPPAYPEPPASFGPAGGVPGQAAPPAPGFGSQAAPPDTNYRLLESIGRPNEPAWPMQAAPHPAQHGDHAGTYGALPGGPPPASTMQSFGMPNARGGSAPSGFDPAGFAPSGLSPDRFNPAGFAPSGPPTAGWPAPVPASALLPAAMVTLPLAEVMRLVAFGAPVVSSPFAAFRVSGGASNSR